MNMSRHRVIVRTLRQWREKIDVEKRTERTMDWLIQQSPVTLALLATLFTWLMTALGAAVVFFFRGVSRRVLNMMLGFASGIMIAASFWSLLAPAIERAQAAHLPAYAVVAVGFVAGALFLVGSDRVISWMQRQRTMQAEGAGNCRRAILLVSSITLHNIPEGMAVGVAFGALAGHSAAPAALLAAISVAVGIGLQNFPEGAAVSLPLLREGMGRFRSFTLGQLSGIVEPIAGVLGAALVVLVEPILPYALAFAAGAMIYVVAEELLPEAQSERHALDHIASIGCVIGFAVMMVMDVALG